MYYKSLNKSNTFNNAVVSSKLKWNTGKEYKTSSLFVRLNFFYRIAAWENIDGNLSTFNNETQCWIM